MMHTRIRRTIGFDKESFNIIYAYKMNMKIKRNGFRSLSSLFEKAVKMFLINHKNDVPTEKYIVVKRQTLYLPLEINSELNRYALKHDLTIVDLANFIIKLSVRYIR
jgi:hypothetical protein